MKISNVYVDFQLNVEEGTSIFHVQATCLIYPKDLNQEINVGEASIYFFNPKKSSYLEVCEEADCISADLYTILTRLPDVSETGKFSGLVAICNELVIKKDWRGKGLGKAFVEKLMQQLSYLNVELVLIKSDYHISSLENIMYQEIKAFYNDLGFYESNKVGEIPVMYKYLNEKRIITIK